MDLIKANAESSKKYKKDERVARRERSAARFARKVQTAWKKVDYSGYYAAMVMPHVAYVDDYGIFVWKHKTGEHIGELRKQNGDLQIVGTRYIDEYSGSALFFNDGKLHSLARFAWWFHYGYDCGAPEHIPHTGGCVLVNSADPKAVAEENLQTGLEYLAGLETEAAQQEKQMLHGMSNTYQFRKAYRLVTSLERCTKHEYKDPIRELVCKDDLELFKRYRVAPTFDALYYRNSGGTFNPRRKGRVKIEPDARADEAVNGRRIVKINRRSYPAANVLWYMVTGTFIGKPVFRDGDELNISLTNLTDKIAQADGQMSARQRIRAITAKMRNEGKL